jgi:hypothetical protein
VKTRWTKGDESHDLKVGDYTVARLFRMDGYWAVQILGHHVGASPATLKDAKRYAERKASIAAGLVATQLDAAKEVGR